ncbi:uncharacterized protein LOC134846031 isoform X2 [Symsagittifera roscoffensis]|uniref:uncharacterized protein LOC134846031 isoform X2 n=1 Tax=Symsagittifera roscoffensis TaxID=84072 RepID=UPI00307BA763
MASSSVDPALSTALDVLTVVFYGTACAALMCNSLIVAVLFKVGISRASLCCMLMVAVADTLTILADSVNFIWDSELGGFCKFWRWVLYTFATAAQNELVLLALDRYLAVRNINRYQQTLMLNISYPVKCFFANLALSALVMSGTMYVGKYNPDSKTCEGDPDVNMHLRLVYVSFSGLVVYFVAPILSILTLTKLLRNKLRQLTVGVGGYSTGTGTGTGTGNGSVGTSSTRSEAGVSRSGLDEKESLVNHGAIVCGFSLVAISCLVALSFVARALINSPLLVSILPSLHTRTLCKKIAMKLIFILLSLNMTVAFVVFTAQSKIFRKSLASIWQRKKRRPSLDEVSTNHRELRKPKRQQRRKQHNKNKGNSVGVGGYERQYREFCATLQILSRKIIQARMGSQVAMIYKSTKLKKPKSSIAFIG